MCGIAGIFHTSSLAADISVAATSMRRSLRHRGPDDDGIWQAASGAATLVHTRLSILDLSSSGHQPMTTHDGRYTITYNGEIYNYLELRSQLEKDGVVLRTRTDTEVLLHLFTRDGIDCLEKLRGMFAFAIWDEHERKGFLARDRFGIKPLYHATIGGRLIFASELRTLTSSGLVDKRLNPTAVLHYLKSGSVPEPYTLFEGVEMLEAGHHLEWHEGAAKTSTWWQLQFTPENTMTADEASRGFRAAMVDAVEHHFVSDVPVGIFLSGGLDSTALLALAKAAGRSNIETFTIGVDHEQLDESSIARRTAGHFGTRHHEMLLDAESGRDLFLKFVDSMDQPSIDGFNTFCVSHLANREGMKVVLSGLGGDELMAGYPSFLRLPKLLHKARMLGPLKKPVGWSLEHFAPHGNLRRLGGALVAGGNLDDLYRAFRGTFSRTEALQLTERLVGTTPTGSYRELPLPPRQPTVLGDISALEITRYMRNQLLRDSDVMSMAWGLELRVPLLDNSLFACLARIPATHRLQQGKQLLLRSVPEIPEWVSKKPKSAFLFPYRQWLESSHWGESFNHAGAGTGVKMESWYQKWCVFMLKHWMDREGMTKA